MRGSAIKQEGVLDGQEDRRLRTNNRTKRNKNIIAPTAIMLKDTKFIQRDGAISKGGGAVSV